MDLKYHIVSFIDILGFKEMVKSDCEQPGKSTFLKSIYNVHQEVKEEFSRYGISITQFSDSIVLSIPLSYENFILMLGTIQKLQKYLLEYKILCRGGIGYGKHFDEEDFIFSQGLIDAYYIESKVSSFPRIVISKELIELYKLEESYKEYLLFEVDQNYYIDYFSLLDKSCLRELLKEIASKVKFNSQSLIDKYKWLQDYYKFVFEEEVDLLKADRFKR